MKRLRPFHIVILCWLLYFIVDSLKKNGLFASGSFFWYQYVPGLIFWVLITLPALRIFSKTERLPLTQRIPNLFGLALTIGFTKNIVAWFVVFVFRSSQGDFPATLGSLKRFFSQVGLFYYMEAIIIAGVMIIVFFIIELQRNYKLKSLEAAELESQLSRSQLESLRMQLQPHFLFNAHNTVSMLIRTKQYDQATEMISKISDLLRNSLNSQEQQFVLLSQELELTTAYLEIEEIRFEDHLKVKFTIDPTLDKVLIPHLLLQPIIENAFKHGISKNLGQSELIITTKSQDGDLIISVYNTGPALEIGWDMKDQTGIGLSNTKERLIRLYGEGGSKFSIQNQDGGVCVTIQLPIKTQLNG